MADESTSPAGMRFSEDLRRIREERGISIQDVHQDTQIAETLIESFEEGRLYDHPTYNRVYLRSFVRAYADAVDISREPALDGLDAALNGSYEHALADQYLADPAGPTPSDEGPSPSSSEAEGPPPSAEVTDAPTAGGPEGRGGIVGPPRAVGEQPDDESSTPAGSQAPSSAEADPPSSPASVRDDEPNDHKEARDRDPKAGDSDEEEGPEASPASGDESEDEPSWKTEDEAVSESDRPDAPPVAEGAESESVSPGGDLGIVGEPTALGDEPSPSPSEEPVPGGLSDGPGEGPPSSSSGTLLTDGRSRVYAIGLGIAVVVLVLVGLGVAYFTTDSSSQPSSQQASPASSADTAAAPAASDPTEPRPPPADVQLGGSIDLTLLAQTDVSGIRIQRDEDLRRPYWIQEGDAHVFPFQEQVTIDSGLSDVRLFIEGYPYPVQAQDTTDALEITRSDVEAFVDTLRGPPSSLSVVPDTIPVGAPNQ